ncbi:MAG TPA: NAD(P)H-hydrate dehydratase [Opitutaceae bacterium]|nr:NAD(P)H-hydrate dehydratase [Opitutaceae bacterium]
MPKSAIPSHPVLSMDDARALEARLLGGDERKEWRAMVRAGRSVAQAALLDCGEAGGFPEAGRILVLAGKGNNAGDALIAAREILDRVPRAGADVLFAFGPRKLGPLAARAWRGLSEACRGRLREAGADTLAGTYDLCLDGIFGLQYRPPLPPEAAAAIEASKRCTIGLRAAVDLPSGCGEPGAFGADFTYATGSVKAPIIGCAHAGRPRYLDLGFFRDAPGEGEGDRVILPSILGPLARLRPAASDKRSQGHLLIVGGSSDLPGAVLMATLSALRSGVGLVTAFVPRGLAPAFASRAPEAMWVGLPETPGGGLALGGLERIMGAVERASALAIGPGLGRDPETLSLAMEIARASPLPVAIDADALQADIVRAGAAPRILTPHAGEFARIARGASLRELCRALPGVVIEKGPVTRISGGGAVYHSFFGGPVLSRGGSGDLLSGLVGGLLAQTPEDPLSAACRGAVWHGMAADLLARSHGQTAVQILQWLDYLGPALRESAACPAS